MKTGQCENFESDLKAFVDGELPAGRRFIVGRHLRGCADCRERMGEMETITRELNAADTTPGLTTELKSRLLSTVAAGSANRAPVANTPLWRQKPGLVFGGGGAVALASALAFVTLYNGAPTGTHGVAFRPGVSAPALEAEKMPAPGAPVSVQVADTSGAGASSNRLANGADESSVGNGPVPGNRAAAKASNNLTYMDTNGVAGNTSGSIVRHALAASSAQPMMKPARGSVVTPNGTASVAYSAPSSTVAALPPPDEDGGRQVHRAASLGVEVTALEATSDRVEEMVKADSGYVASNNLSTDDSGAKSAELSVRVPTKDFETMMASIAKLGNVVSKSVTGEDITDKVSDATSAEQVLVNEAAETAEKLRVQSMSERRTGQKEAELRQIRIQLAQNRARLGLLRKMAALSTIEVSLTEKHAKAPVVHTSAFWNGMQQSNLAAVHAFQAAVRVPLLLAIWAICLSPIWAPLLIAYRWAARRNKPATLAVSNER